MFSVGLDLEKEINKINMGKKQMSPSKDINKIVKLAQKQGWEVVKTNGSHIIFYPPNARDGLVTMPSTPSSTRNFKNVLSLLKSKGLKL